MVGNNLKTMNWKSNGALNLLHLKISSNCLLVIVLELADKANVIVFKIVYPALMHAICLTTKTSKLFIILMTMLGMSVTKMTKAKTRKSESVFLKKFTTH